MSTLMLVERKRCLAQQNAGNELAEASVALLETGKLVDSDFYATAQRQIQVVIAHLMEVHGLLQVAQELRDMTVGLDAEHERT